MRAVCRGILEKQGYEVLEAGTATRASTVLKQNKIDLMLCDLNLPDADGLKLVEAMRQDPAFATLPVVMVTVESNPELVARAQRAGVKEWLSKPYDAAALVKITQRFAGTVQ